MTITIKQKYVTVKELLTIHTWLTEHRLRYFLRRRRENGLQKYIRTPNKTKNFTGFILIDREGFEKWIDSKLEK